MIRPSVPDDTPDLLTIARDTGVFKPLELVALEEVLDDYHAEEHAKGHESLTCEQEGIPIGFAYYAPAAMCDRAWYLYWIAVSKSRHAQGVGTRLLDAAEQDVTRRGARLFLIETSSLPHYEPTRRFYERRGYERACRLADFYADGDDLVVFRKRMISPIAPLDG
jgi:GNAT superfamily N-acetyltransferase